MFETALLDSLCRIGDAKLWSTKLVREHRGGALRVPREGLIEGGQGY